MGLDIDVVIAHHTLGDWLSLVRCSNARYPNSLETSLVMLYLNPIDAICILFLRFFASPGGFYHCTLFMNAAYLSNTDFIATKLRLVCWSLTGLLTNSLCVVGVMDELRVLTSCMLVHLIVG